MFRSSERRLDPSEASLERVASRVDVLAERVDTLAQTVAATAASIAKKDGEIALIRRQLENEQQRLQDLVARASSETSSGELRALRERVSTLASERARTSDEGRLTKLDAKVALLGERMDTLATTVATTAAGLAGRDGEIAALRRRLDEQMPRAGAAADQSLRTRVDDLGAAAASTSMRLESHSTQIAALRDALDARQDTLESALALLAERVEAVERERAALATSVAEAAAARWRELERTLDTLGGRLAALEDDRAEAASALSRATSLWPEALRSLEARVAELARAQERRPDRPPSAAEPHPPEPVQSAPSPEVVRHFLSEIRILERRLENADSAARHEREDLRARVQRLENERGPLTEGDPLPIGADILPFRSGET